MAVGLLYWLTGLLILFVDADLGIIVMGIGVILISMHFAKKEIIAAIKEGQENDN